MASEADRYEGRPLMRYLDCYVLRAIGHLDPGIELTLQKTEPRLRELWNGAGSWVELVEAQLNFPITLPTKILEIWEAGSAKATAQNLTVDPHEFTRQFVDVNFAPMFD